MPDFDFDWLLQEIRYGNVVPIVGAELYLGADGASLEHAIASRLAAELKLPAAAAGATPRDVALSFLAGDGHPQVLKTRLRAITQDTLTAPSSSLGKLAAITDFRLYVTTAADDMLERALTAAGRQGLAFVYSRSRPGPDAIPDTRKTVEPVVYHLLGTMTDTWPITDADVLEYLHALFSETRRPARLFDELANKNLLFLGCGFPDWLSRLFIRVIRDAPFTRGESSTAQVIADARIASDNNLRMFLEHYNLMLYPPGKATDFVDELHRRWVATGPVPAAVAAPRAVMQDGSVFLSFSSGDRETVRAIAEALDAAGIDVWFDETGLAPGVEWDRMISENLLRAALFIPFVSKATESQAEVAKYFWKEWNSAHRRSEYFSPGTRYIVPVALDDIAPEVARVPDSFRTVQWFKLHERVPTPAFIEFVKAEYRRKLARARP
ncbi:MAG TPA: toll/interleukin-1 receptor domain-containing protein [Kofleriaceae bacterium]|nr:toll/interleukin-1 receptor domain-containing protein [Kofleriaceae bacterium]